MVEPDIINRTLFVSTVVTACPNAALQALIPSGSNKSFRNNGDISACIHFAPNAGTLTRSRRICDGYICDGSRRIKGAVVGGHSQRTTSGEGYLINGRFFLNSLDKERCIAEFFKHLPGQVFRRLARGRLRGLDREQQIGPGSAVANVLAFCRTLVFQQLTVLLLVPVLSASSRLALALAPFTNLVLFTTDANKRGLLRR